MAAPTSNFEPPKIGTTPSAPFSAQEKKVGALPLEVSGDHAVKELKEAPPTPQGRVADTAENIAEGAISKGAPSVEKKDVGPFGSQPLTPEVKVEKGLIPAFPIPGMGPGPFSMLDRMRDLGVSEVRMAVINNGKKEWSKEWSLELGKIDERPDMVSQAASISKTVTAMTVLSLIEKCRRGLPSGLVGNMVLDLDTEVGSIFEKDPQGKDLWKKINPKGYPITIEQLLSHTAGIVDAFDEGDYFTTETVDHHFLDKVLQLRQRLPPSLSQENRIAFDVAITKLQRIGTQTHPPDIGQQISQTQQEIYTLVQNFSSSFSQEDTAYFTEGLEKLQSLQKMREKALVKPLTTDEVLQGKVWPVYVKFSPGETYEGSHYSNMGFVILQKVVEIATHQQFPEVVQERIFTPLQMRNSTYTPPIEKTIPGNDDEGNPLLGLWSTLPWGPGGLWTNASDCAKIALAIQRGSTGGPITDAHGETIIGPKLAAEMIKDPPLGANYRYTLGTEIEKMENGTSYFFHTGRTAGCYTLMIGSCTKEGQGVVILTNSSAGGKDLCEEIMRSITNAYAWPGKETLSFIKKQETAPVDISSWVNGADGVGGRYIFKEVIQGEEVEHTVDVTLEGGEVLAKVDKLPPLHLTPINNRTACYREHSPGPYKLCRFEKENDGNWSLYLWGAKHVRPPGAK